ncbi:aminotransferase class V-fold PLP-dependent enzyme [uncultured Ruminococcus sp.]|uniref:aminotransferase class V-fold PLP-dependent enzyme n=1 Tax=uncultured Ruminococcus sp. TaxID=165186 RepID=UPI0026770D08|nr:SufS family cysteine desulfurase [uncultured Ruminococcus sp.]
MTAWNPENVRQDFVLLQNTDRVYFDNAATSQKPKCVIDAVQEFYEKYNANVLRGLYPLSVEATERYENARKTVQRFIHAACPEEIIFTRNATESMNLVAYSYGMANLKAGDEILVSILEHHSNILPWQMVSRATGAKLVFLECEPDGTIPKEKMDEVFSEHTKLVAVTQVSNVLGCVNDIPELVKRARACGAVILMDAAQSAPHMPIDVQKLDVDFVAFSGHKMLAPMGIGVLYGKQELLEKMPPFLTGGEMIETVSRYDAVYAELPHKFEAGTVNAGGAVGLAAAIDYLESYSMDTLHAVEQELTAYLFRGMNAIPHVHVLGSQREDNHTGIVSFTVDQVHPHDISEVLSSDGMDIRAGHHCAQPLHDHLGIHSTARASLMFYNTKEEIDRFLESVSNIRRRMGFGNE